MKRSMKRYGAVAPEPLDEPRFNETFWVRVATGGFGLLACSLFVLGLFAQPRVRPLRSGDRHAAADAALDRELRSLAGAVGASERDRVVKRIRDGAARYRSALLRRLGDRAAPFMKEAFYVAGAIDLEAARTFAVTSSGRGAGGGVSVAAMRAAHRLQRWSSEELAEFLRDGDTAMQLAVLRIVEERGQGPWPAVLDALFHGTPEVRRAALEAVPEKIPMEVVRELLQLIREGHPDEVVPAVLALGQTTAAADYESEITALLERREPGIRPACLDFLGGLGRRLENPGAVWQVVVDMANEEALRARAVLCLERTGSYDSAQVRERMFFMTPLVKYCAARCLLRDRDPAGLKALLEVVRERDPSDPEVVVAARGLLSWITGLGASVEPEQFEAAFRSSGQRIRSNYMPSSPLPRRSAYGWDGLSERQG